MIALGLLAPASAPYAGSEPPAPPIVAPRGLARWASAVALLPVPIWFVTSTVFAPAPAWRAEYRQNSGPGGAGVVAFERELARYWDKSHAAVPGGLSHRDFAAHWDGCLTLREARDIPFMLSADGSAVFSIDGAERLRAQSASGMRATRGDSIRLEAGSHHLHVELEPRGWPSVALLASFDGKAPRAVGSGELSPGIRTTPPSDGPAPCPGR